jgi:hypothetical protein
MKYKAGILAVLAGKGHTKPGPARIFLQQIPPAPIPEGGSRGIFIVEKNHLSRLRQ